jgi:hypothetical protein
MAHLDHAALYGMEPPSEEQARHDLSHLQSQFEQRAGAQAASAADNMALVAALHRIVDLKSAGTEELVKSLRAKQEQAARHRRSAPEMKESRARLFTGSLGATLTPPYNWSWTWHASNGASAINSASADNRSGKWSVSDWASLDNASNASARAAVGIFFRPPTATGLLRVWSNPAINFNWGDWCAFDGAGSDGWLGLYVGEYNVDGGGFAGAPVDQQINLWSDKSWWSGVGGHQGANSGYPLQATLEVDNAHFYEIWVWGGTDVYADGWGTFTGSGAGGDLSAWMPSITWELH